MGKQNQKEEERGMIKRKKTNPFLWPKRKYSRAGGRGEGLIPGILAAHLGCTFACRTWSDTFYVISSLFLSLHFGGQNKASVASQFTIVFQWKKKHTLPNSNFSLMDK